MTTTPPLHVFIFSCPEYRDLVPQCLASIQRFVQDPIASINIVAPCQIDIPGTTLILDQDFWKKLDPESKYTALYSSNWTRQQIFKLNVDQYVTGQALICDAEVVFLRPTKFFENDRVNYYTTPAPTTFEHNTQFAFLRKILGFDKQEKNSFVTDVQVFDTEMLKDMRNIVEQRYDGRDWLELHDFYLMDGTKTAEAYSLGEFEVFLNFMVKMHPEKINKIKGPFRYIYLNNDRLNMTVDELIELAKQQTPNDFISVNLDIRSWSGTASKWLTFYTQVRDPSWPDCDNEEDFVNLPKHIQDECVNVFGYAPPKKAQ